MSKPSHNGQDPTSGTTVDLHPRFYREGGYEKIPRWVRRLHEAGEITDSQRQLLDTVADETYSWNRPCVLLSSQDLAKAGGVSRRHALRLRDELVSQGLLIQTECETEHGQGYVYSIPMHLSARKGDSHREARLRTESRLRRLGMASTDVEGSSRG